MRCCLASTTEKKDVLLSLIRSSRRSMSSESDSASVPTAESTPAPPKRICCACPETRKPRDECVTHHGEENCTQFIEAHKACLRAEGFNV